MAEDTTAFVIPLHQPRQKKKDRTGAERAKAYRARKKQKTKVIASAEVEPPSYELLIPPEFLPANDRTADAAEPLRPAGTQAAPATSLRRRRRRGP